MLQDNFMKNLGMSVLGAPETAYNNSNHLRMIKEVLSSSDKVDKTTVLNWVFASVKELKQQRKSYRGFCTNDSLQETRERLENFLRKHKIEKVSEPRVNEPNIQNENNEDFDSEALNWEAEKVDMLSKISDLEITLEEYKVEYTKAREEVRSKTRENERLNRDLGSLKKENCNLKKEIGTIRSQNEVLGKEISNLKEDREKLKNHVCDVERQVQDYKSEIHDYKLQNNSLLTEFRSMRGEIDKIKRGSILSMGTSLLGTRYDKSKLADLRKTVM